VLDGLPQPWRGSDFGNPGMYNAQHMQIFSESHLSFLYKYFLENDYRVLLNSYFTTRIQEFRG
jgi:hypothetical protein